MALTAQLDAFQRRHPAAGFPLAVLYKYFDDQGGYLAALIAYYGFVSLFPLLLLLSTVLGLVLDGNPGAQMAVLKSALSQFPGVDLGDPGSIGGGVKGLVVGSLGALYGGLGVAQAIQNAMNTAWAVPKNDRPNPFKVRARSLLLLLTVGLAVVGTTVLASVGAHAEKLLGPNGFGAGTRVLVIAGSVALNALAFWVGFHEATARRVRWRQVLPGAVAAAVVWQLLQTFGARYVGRVVGSASDSNAVFALVLGLLAFLYLAAVALVFCVEVNVVRVDRLYPRALLTPFTDAVSLTPGDERAYRQQTKAQRSKGFQEVRVRFRRRS